MANEGGEWIMHGLAWDDPLRIRTWQELVDYIDRVGFLPLFANELRGFSAEEHVSDLFWWTDDPEQDPWKWREIIARSGQVIYGKFFRGRAGFISLKWFPVFANWRRDGYDFDARWDDALASRKAKKIMDLFEVNEQLRSYEIKRQAGFGKDGEKNFEGVITELQMQGYLIIRDFSRRRRARDGAEYGWPISVYTTPEHLLGSETVASAYSEQPNQSRERIFSHILHEYPAADAQRLTEVFGV